MSGSETTNKPLEPDAAAFEYVAGTLPASERAEFERELLDNAELRERVAFWEEQLQHLHANTEELPPRADLWDRISAGIEPAAKNAQPEQAKPFSWAALLQWGAPTMAAIALAVVLIGYYPKTVDTVPAIPDYVAVLTDEGGNALLTALTTEEGNNMYLKWEEQLTVPPDKNVQLWAVSKRDGQTRPLAVFTSTEIRELPLDEATWRLVTDSAFLLLTEEEEGGSPLDEPSETLLAKGVCVRFSRESTI